MSYIGGNVSPGQDKNYSSISEDDLLPRSPQRVQKLYHLGGKNETARTARHNSEDTAGNFTPWSHIYTICEICRGL